jgi:hypothetical protein
MAAARNGVALAVSAGLAMAAGASAQVTNAGFETGDFTGWTIGSAVPPPAVVSGNAHSGTYSAFLGSSPGVEPDGDCTLYQTVTVPAGTALAFWFTAFSEDVVEYDWQDVLIQDTSGNTLATARHACGIRSWRPFAYDLSAFAGQTVRIVFLVHQDGFGDVTSMNVDDVTFAPAGRCCAPNGICSIQTAANCAAISGTYGGNGTVCTGACPGGWIETADAGELPSSAAVTSGTGLLRSISGALGALNDVDMFKLRICDPPNFSATTVDNTDIDTQLFLFNSAGMGVMSNDDASADLYQSTLNNSNASCPASAGVYYLAVNNYNRDATSSGGTIFPSTFEGIFCATGPGGGSPVSGWMGVTEETGPYDIVLTGTCYHDSTGQACYANCDSSTALPFLNVQDFTCFLGKFAAGNAYANCDASTVAPALNVQDFTCFLNKFAAGCSAP